MLDLSLQLSLCSFVPEQAMLVLPPGAILDNLGSGGSANDPITDDLGSGGPAGGIVTDAE